MADTRAETSPPTGAGRGSPPARTRNFSVVDGAIAIALAGMPVLWALGIDQAAWLLLAGPIALVRGPRVVSRSLVLLALSFLVVATVSGVLSASGIRWITLTRTILIIAAFLAIGFGVARRSVTNRLDPVVIPMAVFIVLSSAISAIVLFAQSTPTFQTPLAALVPPEIARTGLGNLSLVTRSLGDVSSFLGFEFLRPRGLFLFSTSQAVAQAVWIPLLFALAAESRRWSRLYYTGAAITFIGLVATTTRFAVLAVFIGFAAIWFIERYRERRIVVEIPVTPRSLSAGVPLIGLLLAGALAFGLLDPFINLLTTRSLDSRGTLYSQTLEAWEQRPILGWGTEHDVIITPPPPTPTPSPTPSSTPSPTPRLTPTLGPEDLPPLGSHSTYLGTLYKQGVIGEVLLIAMLAYLLAAAAQISRKKSTAGSLVVAALITALVAGITEEWWLDPATSSSVAVAFGALLGLAGGGRLVGPPRVEDEPAQ